MKVFQLPCTYRVSFQASSSSNQKFYSFFRAFLTFLDPRISSAVPCGSVFEALPRTKLDDYEIEKVIKNFI